MSKVKKTLLANNFLDLTEVKLVGKKYDSVGILAIVKSYFAMSESSDGYLEKEEILMIAEGWAVEDVEGWLSLCVLKNIFTEESGRYYNTHVKRDRENYAKKLEYDRKRKGIKTDSVRKEDGKKTDPDIDIDFDIDINKKNSQQPVQPELIKLSEFVRLSQFNREMFKKRCLDEKFTAKETKEIIESLDRWFAKNQEKWREEDHFRDLCSWPMKQAREEKAKLERARGSPKIGVIEKPHPITSVRPKGF